MNTAITVPLPETDRTVYVRTVEVDDLPAELAAQVDPARPIYAIHSKDGECLALARDRNVAFALARTNEMTPVSVH